MSKINSRESSDFLAFCSFSLLARQNLNAQSFQMSARWTPIAGMCSAEGSTPLARFMPLEMHALISTKHSTLPRDTSVLLISLSVPFPMWLFQIPHSFQTPYPTSSPVTLSNKSCQQILEKTEARREFPQFLPPSLKLVLHPHWPLSLSLDLILSYIPKSYFPDCLLSSVSLIFYIVLLTSIFNMLNFLLFCQTLASLVYDTTALNTFNLTHELL